MRITINGSNNLVAIANRLKNDVVDCVHHTAEVVTSKIQDTRQKQRAFQDNAKELVADSQKLGHSLGSLNNALTDLPKTIIALDKKVGHWTRANEVPFENINQVLKKYQK